MGGGTGTVENQEPSLMAFDSILTAQISKFHIETWNLAKIEVVEDEKIYNFDIGQKLIWNSDQGEKGDWTQLKWSTLCKLN